MAMSSAPYLRAKQDMSLNFIRFCVLSSSHSPAVNAMTSSILTWFPIPHATPVQGKRNTSFVFRGSARHKRLMGGTAQKKPAAECFQRSVRNLDKHHIRSSGRPILYPVLASTSHNLSIPPPRTYTLPLRESIFKFASDIPPHGHSILRIHDAQDHLFVSR